MSPSKNTKLGTTLLAGIAKLEAELRTDQAKSKFDKFGPVSAKAETAKIELQDLLVDQLLGAVGSNVDRVLHAFEELLRERGELVTADPTVAAQRPGEYVSAWEFVMTVLQNIEDNHDPEDDPSDFDENDEEGPGPRGCGACEVCASTAPSTM